MNTNAPQTIECPVCDWLENLESDDWNAACEEIAAFAKQGGKEVPEQSGNSVQAMTVLGSRVKPSVAGRVGCDNRSPTALAAIATLGAELIAYRVNRRPEQRTHLLALFRRAARIGALCASDRATLRASLFAGQEVSHA
ncbi:hypothetical protein ACM719_12520 [Pseudomonas aeruginosa]|uniref:hypothetical protein n=1 Tax=Pseudomonas aeruginosa TaxID=287 RepID=UPI002A6A8BA5|nr:hypothetical protein [Pseudomonas aeruginosa]MDY1175719.1 hypothetical protein [Pseudomonas aeruginosa]